MKIEMVDLKREYQELKRELLPALEEVMEAAAYIKGPAVQRFSENMEALLQVKHHIPCANGTDALTIAMMALDVKAGDEVILKTARRMWYWRAKKSISLSACAIYGVDHDKSKVVEAVPSVWLEAIEIIPCSDAAIESLEGAPNVKAE